MRLRLLSLLILPSYAAFSQTTKPIPVPDATVCMPAPQAAKVRDSLRVLPKVRREARSWRTAATNYRAAADTVRAAYYREASASANLSLALRDEKVEAARYEVKAKEWKEKAQRRGFWNWVAAAAVVLLTVISTAH